MLLVGRVVSLDSGSMRVETCDKRQVTVALKAGAGAYANSDFIEFEATVESPEAVRELEHAKFGTTFGACPADGVAAQTWAPLPKQGLGALCPCAHAERGAALPASLRHGQLQRAGQDGARQRTGAVLLRGCAGALNKSGPKTRDTVGCLASGCAIHDIYTRPAVVVTASAGGAQGRALAAAQLKPQGRQSLLWRARAAKPAAWPREPHAMTSTRLKPAGSPVFSTPAASSARMSPACRRQACGGQVSTPGDGADADPVVWAQRRHRRRDFPAVSSTPLCRETRLGVRHAVLHRLASLGHLRNRRRQSAKWQGRLTPGVGVPGSAGRAGTRSGPG